MGSSDDSTMRIRLHGKLAQMVGRETDVAVEPQCTVAALRDAVIAAYPSAGSALNDKRMRVCIGGEIVADDHRPGPGDEVEFLAPVSGG